MGRKKTRSYEVGYGRPPVANRFSATSQPKRLPKYPEPKGKQMRDLNSERLPIKRRDGTQKHEAADAVIAEVFITKAINGDLGAAREVYRLVDAEEDAAAMRGPSPSPTAVKKLRGLLADALGRYQRIAMELEQLGLVRNMEGQYRVSTKAKQLASRMKVVDHSSSD